MRRTITLASLASFVALGADAQSDSPPCAATMPAPHQATAFLDSARVATARYADHSAAVADGYRLIGPDFPLMGEHWILLPMVFSSRIDPTRPAVLTYVRIAERQVLTGVAYARALRPHEHAPNSPISCGWHDHVRSIVEETLLTEHIRSPAESGDWRLAMLHAWLWVENPDGMFAAENPALPFLRLGLAAPEVTPDMAAVRALALAAGGVRFYATVISRLGASDAHTRHRIEALLAAAQDSARAIVADVPQGESQSAALSAVWNFLSDSIDAVVPPSAADLVALYMRPPERPRAHAH